MVNELNGKTKTSSSLLKVTVIRITTFHIVALFNQAKAIHTLSLRFKITMMATQILKNRLNGLATP